MSRPQHEIGDTNVSLLFFVNGPISIEARVPFKPQGCHCIDQKGHSAALVERLAKSASFAPGLVTRYVCVTGWEFYTIARMLDSGLKFLRSNEYCSQCSRICDARHLILECAALDSVRKEYTCLII